MYIMDYKIPKYLDPLKRQLVVDFWYECGDTIYPNARPTSRVKSENAIACLTGNIISHLAFGMKTIPITLDSNSYKQPLIYNGVMVNRKVSYPHTLNVINWLSQSGRATLHKGGVEEWAIGTNGRLEPVSTNHSYLEIRDSFKELLSPYADKRKLPTLENVLEMKDSSKKIIPKDIGVYQKYVIGILQQSNKLYRQVNISVGDVVVDVQLKKVYNNDSWDEGGRDYIVGSAVAEGLMWKENRPGLKIDGEDTCEIDYCALHPRIAAELSEIRLEADFDPYHIYAEGYSPIGLRTLCKLSLLVCLNAGYAPMAKPGSKGSAENAVKAIRWELYRNGMLQGLIDNGDVPNNILYRDIILKLVVRNPYLTDWMLNPQGLRLQNIDSQMMDIILDRFNRIGEVVIPFHDSIVVKKSLQEFGKEIMMDAYKAVLGTNYNCKLKVKG